MPNCRSNGMARVPAYLQPWDFVDPGKFGQDEPLAKGPIGGLQTFSYCTRTP